ncbi:MAG TPA: peptide chain release factor 1 [Flavobacteriales bacterium]|nr:peptide chain release factor 1 [Flavobacteriales bacterium]
MLEKLAEIKVRWEEVNKLIANPEIIADMKKYVRLSKELKELEEVVEIYEKYKLLLSNIQSSREIMAGDEEDELKAMAKEELEELLGEKSNIEESIKVMLIPKDPEDEKNAVVEIRAGTGGDEASIFAGDLFRMYTKYCDSRKWKTELVDMTEGTSGGYKEVIFNVIGEDIYGQLKYESGVHRVQRVPKTETQGRVHTSAATVAILPEADEFDVVIRDEDIKKDTFCSSGPGGQSVNTTYSAIRLTHIPTGIVVQCQDEKSQIKNYNKAMANLRSKLYELEMQKRADELASKRKTLVSTGDRSAKIRTYNYPQGRVTEHRIGLTKYDLQNIMDGNIQEIIDELQLAENTERLKEGSSDTEDSE